MIFALYFAWYVLWAIVFHFLTVGDFGSFLNFLASSFVYYMLTGISFAVLYIVIFIPTPFILKPSNSDDKKYNKVAEIELNSILIASPVLSLLFFFQSL